MFGKNISYSLFPYLTALVCCTGIIGLQQQHSWHNLISPQHSDYLRQNQALKANLEFQKTIPYFGFNNLLADWNFLQYIQYFGDQKTREKIGYSLTTDYFEAVVKADPRFIKAVLAFSPANSIFAGKPEKTVILMDRVLQSISPENFPFAYLVWSYKGTDEILFLGDINAAKHSYLMAAKWAEARGDEFGKQAAIRPREIVQFLDTKPNPQKVQIYAWLELLDYVRDEQTIAKVVTELRALGCQVIPTENGKFNIIVPKI